MNKIEQQNLRYARRLLTQMMHNDIGMTEAEISHSVEQCERRLWGTFGNGSSVATHMMIEAERYANM